MPDENLAEELSEELTDLLAPQGEGHLLQRDYWTTISQAQLSPEEIIHLLLHEFPRFSSERIATFEFEDEPPLKEGDKMLVDIRGYGKCHVLVKRLDERSLTLCTLKDHYEAGRITFGAWREKGEREGNGPVTFKIRSRARNRSKAHAWMFLVAGHKFQKQLWVHFAQSLARACGAQGEIEVREETREVQANLADTGEINAPTFVA